ncbi:signal transduction histidine kinase [Lipingzhangella halophila]|uniref:Signal transduction histidine kinase n=1 Tax=Lipingzhangella halophila TaxID=1783352 RepID=A0A7W7RE12_9ACTN|nr:sensor histidine kinase [Lipingzhangella halophila]MBB4930261.1 signal transduction histidine kinase [Lipingzhangella halophila]
MDSRDDGAELDRLLTFDGRTAPALLNQVFWGVLVVYGVVVVVNAVRMEYSALSGVGLGVGPIVLFQLGAMAAAAVLWPTLPWHRGAPRGARLRSVLFFAATLVLLAFGNAIMSTFIIATAVCHAVIVFGGRAAAGYAAATGLTAFTLHLAPPEPDPGRAVLEAGGILLVCAVMVVLFRSLDRARRKAEETRGLLAELRTAHDELRRYSDRVRDLTVAEERARMARDMHDSVGHYLTVINMDLTNAERFRVARPDDAWQEVHHARQLAQEALADTRRWVRAMRPLRLQGCTGVEALRVLAGSFDGTGIEVRLRVLGEVPELDEVTELLCYRVVQEGCTNALRHSGATLVDAELSGAEAAVVLTVRDNGVGADAAAVDDGFGLRGLRERVEAAGGEFAVRSPTAGGFEISATVPRPPDPVGQAEAVRTEAER